MPIRKPLIKLLILTGVKTLTVLERDYNSALNHLQDVTPTGGAPAIYACGD
jgi:hypothetical protein